jgi:diguanylate cyclase (GGDEF)-like protein
VAVEGSQPASLGRLAEEIRGSAAELALAVVAEGLDEDQIPSLGRLGREGQLGGIPIFISELAGELDDPQPGRLHRGGQLAALVRDHARTREELGFAPREIVTEFLVLRRVLWRFVGSHTAAMGTGDVLVLERRLNDTIDRLVTECVVAYFDRATLELANQARRDALTQLLNHQAFTEELEAELDRARRYDHGLTLVVFDIDEFKAINDTHGHPEGDRVLRELARALNEGRRGSDFAGRMGGDEFAVALVESEPDAGVRFVARLRAGIAAGNFPLGFTVSAGKAHFPSDGEGSVELFRVADRRLYEAKPQPRES